MIERRVAGARARDSIGRVGAFVGCAQRKGSDVILEIETAFSRFKKRRAVPTGLEAFGGTGFPTLNRGANKHCAYVAFHLSWIGKASRPQIQIGPS